MTKAVRTRGEGNHDAAERRADSSDSIEADGEEGDGSGNIASVDDVAGRSLPGEIIAPHAIKKLKPRIIHGLT